jgi:hypothetical protein
MVVATKPNATTSMRVMGIKLSRPGLFIKVLLAFQIYNETTASFV